MFIRMDRVKKLATVILEDLIISLGEEESLDFATADMIKTLCYEKIFRILACVDIPKSELYGITEGDNIDVSGGFDEVAERVKAEAATNQE